MKVAIITSLLALGTGLTGVLGAPVRDVNSDLATRGNELATIVTRDNGMIVERDEERHKKHKPTWCGEPFCAPKSVKERGEETASLVPRDEERKGKHKLRPSNPTWCGAPFCASKSVEERGEVAASLVSRDEEHRKPRPHDPYWCGAPFCARDANMTPRELDSFPVEKRAENITKCWEAPNGQFHCQWSAKRDSLVKREEAITKCWEAPDGQIHCQWAADLSKRSESITKCWEALDGQIHCQWAKREEVADDVTKCWEAAEGQIHCQWAKREAEPVADINV